MLAHIRFLWPARVAGTALLLSSLALGTAGAAASVTIGQLSPAPMGTCTVADQDVLTATVPSGPSYVSPTNGTLLSWSTNAFSASGQKMGMKLYRKVSDPATYTVVAHDGPRDLAPSVLNIFAGLNIPIKAGDVVGINQGNASFGTPQACAFSSGGASFVHNPPGLADGQQAPFTPAPNFNANVVAVIEPDSKVQIGAVTNNRKKGTATISLNLPNPGDLSGSGKGVSASSARANEAKAVQAGAASLLVRASGKARKKLNSTGKVRVTVTVTYTPTGGTVSSTPVQVKLKKS